MFDIGLQEMLVIGVLALLVFGPSKLPELGRMIGRAMREFRRASDEFRSTVETNLQINEPDPLPGTIGVTDSGAGADPVDALGAPTSGLAPEPQTNGALEIAADASTEPYCAQRGSRLFHRRDCAWVARIPEGDRVYLKKLDDARDQGFATCPVCEPWEPA
jgi:TatA/E family protein of Tat protein translocase